MTELKKRELLQGVGLRDTSVSIYLFLLQKKQATVLEIARGTDIARTNIYTHLELLKSFDLVRERLVGKKRFFLPQTPDNLTNIIKNKDSLAREAARVLSDDFEMPNKDIGMGLSYGREGFINCFKSVVADPKISVYQMINVEMFEEFCSKKFLASYYKQKIKQKVYTYILMSELDRVRVARKFSEIENIKLLQEIRYLATDININFSFIVKEETCYLIAPPKEGCFIHFINSHMATSLKELFNLLWKTANR